MVSLQSSTTSVGHSDILSNIGQPPSSQHSVFDDFDMVSLSSSRSADHQSMPQHHEDFDLISGGDSVPSLSSHDQEHHQPQDDFDVLSMSSNGNGNQQHFEDTSSGSDNGHREPKKGSFDDFDFLGGGGDLAPSTSSPSPSSTPQQQQNLLDDFDLSSWSGTSNPEQVDMPKEGDLAQQHDHHIEATTSSDIFGGFDMVGNSTPSQSSSTGAHQTPNLDDFDWNTEIQEQKQTSPIENIQPSEALEHSQPQAVEIHPQIEESVHMSHEEHQLGSLPEEHQSKTQTPDLVVDFSWNAEIQEPKQPAPIETIQASEALEHSQPQAIEIHPQIESDIRERHEENVLTVTPANSNSSSNNSNVPEIISPESLEENPASNQNIPAASTSSMDFMSDWNTTAVVSNAAHPVNNTDLLDDSFVLTSGTTTEPLTNISNNTNNSNLFDDFDMSSWGSTSASTVHNTSDLLANQDLFSTVNPSNPKPNDQQLFDDLSFLGSAPTTTTTNAQAQSQQPDLLDDFFGTSTHSTQPQSQTQSQQQTGQDDLLGLF